MTYLLSRRRFLAFGASLLAVAACSGEDSSLSESSSETPSGAPTMPPAPVSFAGVEGLAAPPETLITEVVADFSLDLRQAPDSVELTYRVLQDHDSHPYVVGLTQEGYPLVLAHQAASTTWDWVEASCGVLASKVAMKVGSFFGGNNIDPAQLSQVVRRITDVQRKEFSIWGAYHDAKVTMPQPGAMNFGPLEATLRGIPSTAQVLFHPMMWSSGSPNWYRGLGRSQLLEANERYVREYLARVNLRASSTPIVVVLNEAYEPYDFFPGILGTGYEERPYEIAREVSPSARLIYNHFSNHSAPGSPGGERTSATRKIVDSLARRGLLDGVGLEMYIDGARPPRKSSVVETMKSYGVPVYVTEFSIYMQNFPGTRDEKLMQQASIAEEMMEAARESGVCPVFINFQTGDKYSVLVTSNNPTMGSPEAMPTPFDEDLRKKPFVYAQRRALMPA